MCVFLGFFCCCFFVRFRFGVLVLLGYFAPEVLNFLWPLAAGGHSPESVAASRAVIRPTRGGACSLVIRILKRWTTEISCVLFSS